MARSLLLDVDAWDLVIGADGNIAVADDPYALAQNVASAIRLFLAELWYDTTKGVPYWQTILGKAPPLNFMRQQFEAAAMTVVGVRSAKCFFLKLTNRELTGQVQISDQAGKFTAITFTRTPDNTISAVVAGAA